MPRGKKGTSNSEEKNETKHEKFQRLATPRINKVLTSLRILGNLSNRAQYDYTAEDVDKMFDALNEVITTVNAKYRKGLAKGTEAEVEEGFKF
jgi:hypothetical protein